MKPVYQTKTGPDGNCLQCCIASLLEVELEEVPEITEDSHSLLMLDGWPYPVWWVELQRWLSERGLFFLEVKLPANMPFMPLPFSALCIFFGETASGVRHAIVGKIAHEEFIPVFNPSPKAEIKSIEGLGFLVERRIT